MGEKDKFWEYFDDESREYVATIMEVEGDYYEESAKFINADLPLGQVLDIGNGGIINYDYSNLEELVCADISISPKIQEVYKNVPNVSFVETDITHMDNIADGIFDAVIVQKVIHHLAENSYKKTRQNTIKAMKECIRVLKNSGSLIICESTMSRWFECLERAFYPLMMKCCDLVHFDRVYQYSAKSLKNIIENDLKDIAILEKISDIGSGGQCSFWVEKFRHGYFPAA